MNLMKRALTLILSVILLLSLFACGAEEEEQAPLETSAESQAAIAAFGEKDYKKAFEESAKAKDLSVKNRVIIEKTYMKNCLIEEEGRFADAAALLEQADWPEEEKTKFVEEYGALGMTEKGAVVSFGTLDMQKVEWIVLDVTEETVGDETHKIARLLTRHVVGAPAGWGNKTTEYASSDLYVWCEVNFMMQLEENLTDAEKKSIYTTKIMTDAGEIEARCFAPSKEEIETYLAGDLKQYRKAAPTEEAKLRGITGEYASYYLRDLGDLVDDTQFVCGVNKDGEIGQRYGRSLRAIGARDCLCIDLGRVEK